MRVAKWGNSLAVRLPKGIVDELGISDGDDVTLRVLGPREFGVERPLSVEEHLQRLRALRSVMPDGYRFDREDANER